MKKRGAGGGLSVLKAQHFDAAISLARRLAIKFARFSQIGSSLYDPQTVTGTLGNLAGAFLMQLVGSPSTRPPFGHLWSFGVPALYNGDGTATPILDAWANKDTDVEPLTVDIGTQTLSAGAYGLIFRGTVDDSQALVFMGAGIGGSSGAGGGGWYGNGLDGAVTFAANPSDTDALVPHPVTGSNMQCVYSSGTGAWNSSTNNYRRPIAYAIKGSDLQLVSIGNAPLNYAPATAQGVPGANYFPHIDPTKWYFFFTRDCYFTTCSIGPGCVLVPGMQMLCATVGFVGPTGAVEISGDGDLAASIIFQVGTFGATGTFQGNVLAGRNTSIGCGAIYGGAAVGGIGGWNQPRAAKSTTGAGLNGQSRGTAPPFDESSIDPITTAPLFLSGSGGISGVGQNGGLGSGIGYITDRGSANPMFAMPISAAAGGGITNNTSLFGVTFGGASGGGGGLHAAAINSVGGLGGFGGAAILIRGKAFDSNIKITSRGGKGFPAYGGASTGGTDPGGGGGGGNGGYAVVLCDDPLTLTTDFSVGTGGAGINGGSAGSSGNASGVIMYPPTH